MRTLVSCSGNSFFVFCFLLFYLWGGVLSLVRDAQLTGLPLL